MRLSDDVAALNDLRFNLDLSFRQLAAKSALWGIRLSSHTWHQLLTDPAAVAKAHDRTHYKLRTMRQRLERDLIAPRRRRNGGGAL